MHVKCLSVLYFPYSLLCAKRLNYSQPPNGPLRQVNVSTLKQGNKKEGEKEQRSIAIKLFLCCCFLLHRIQLCCNICNIATVVLVLVFVQCYVAKPNYCGKTTARRQCSRWWWWRCISALRDEGLEPCLSRTIQSTCIKYFLGCCCLGFFSYSLCIQN